MKMANLLPYLKKLFVAIDKYHKKCLRQLKKMFKEITALPRCG
jgi:hypothetical protein